MLSRKSPEVIVAGAGPVGLFAGLSLARKGMRVRVIDEGWRAAAHSYALALHPSTLRILNKAGAVGKLVDKAQMVRTVAFYEGSERRAAIDLGQLGADFSFVAVIPQNRLEAALEEALQAHGVSVQWNHRLARLKQEEGSDKVDVTIDRMTVESMGYAVAHTETVVAASHEHHVPLVIGADGHSSLVRRSLGIDFENAGPTRYFAVFEFATDYELTDEMRIAFAENTTSVLWPVGAGTCRWSFELSDFAVPPASRHKDRFLIQREDVPELSDESLAQHIEERAPWFDGSVDRIEWKTVVRFEQRLATQFGHGRVWLAGDSAHMAGPVPVRSMNVGLKEAADLGERMAGVLSGDQSPDMLAEYGRERLAEWRVLLGLEGAVTATPEASPWVRAHARRIVSAIPASGSDLEQLAGQLGLSLVLPKSPAGPSVSVPA